MFGERAVVVIVLKCIGWLRSSGNMPLSWIGIFLLTVLCSCYAEQVSLVCEEGWTSVGVGCYRLFPQPVQWDSAVEVCQRYGAHLTRIKDLQRNETAIGAVAREEGVTELWLAYSSARHFSPQAVTPVYQPAHEGIGTMNSSEPAPEPSGRCVLAGLMEGHVVWTFAPCGKLAAFVCLRSAAPAGSFHCANGRFVEQLFVCDGEDDCGDDSDEMNCKNMCTHHLRETSGVITSPAGPEVYPNRWRCLWLLETSVGYNLRLEFTDLSAERPEYEVTVLVGGMTLSTSRQVARLSGDVDTQTFTSVNNLLILTFTSDAANISSTGFRASFYGVKAEGFEPHKTLPATSGSQDLFSPFYPQYVSSQDYVWLVTTPQSFNVLTLQIIDVDLKGDDTVQIRDGNSVYSPSLRVLTSERDERVTHVQGTRHEMYIAMRTRGLETGRGFHFKYWQGCSLQLGDASGTVVSPGYLIQGANYPANQTCSYDIIVPGLQTATLIFSAVDIHPSDEIKIEEAGQLVHSVSGTVAPPPVDISSGSFTLIFRSDTKLTSRGFSVSYSIGCPKLRTNSQTAIDPETPVYHFGTKVTLSCGHGYAFAAEVQQYQTETGSRVVLECLQGGMWNVTEIPGCKAYCAPGWFFDTVTESCEACRVGYFQTQVNRTSCSRCPGSTTTETMATNSSAECKKSCPAGQRYVRHSESCEECPVGFFQSRPGQFQCQKCPSLKTTSTSGATSAKLCTEDEIDQDTAKELYGEGLITVSIRHLHPRYHLYHADFASKATTSLHTLIRPQRQGPPAQRAGTLLSPGRSRLGDRTQSEHADTPEDVELLLGGETRSRDLATPAVLSEPPEKPGSVLVQRLFPNLEEIGLRREKRETEQAEEDLECSGGSGWDNDPCNTTTGQPCNDRQECIPYWDNTYRCACKAGYQENDSGDCVELPESQKLYLTTPLDVAFDPDLSLQSSMAFLTFQSECEEAFKDAFRVVEGCKTVQVLYFRSEAGGSDKTVVSYAILFTVNVTMKMLNKVATTVLQMEQAGQILIGDRNFTITDHTGIFKTATAALTGTDDVDWCSEAALHSCPADRECEDTGLRYVCRCAGSTSDVGGSCLNVGAVVGGVIGAVVILAVIAAVVVFILMKRRRLSADTMPDDPKTDGESAFALQDRSAQDDDKLEEEKPEDEAHVYDRTTDDVTPHHYTSLQGAGAGGADQERTGYANVDRSSAGVYDVPEKHVDEANVYYRTTDDVTSHYYTSLQGVAQGGRAGGVDQERTGYANVAGSGGAGDGPMYINAGALVEGGQHADSTYQDK